MTNRTNIRKNNHLPQYENGQLTAGILTPTSHIEAFGVLKTRGVYFLRKSKRITLKQLPTSLFNAIKHHMQSNAKAVVYLDASFDNELDKMQEYLFCMWGLADVTADFVLDNGRWILSPPENFTCDLGEQCHCKNWEGKQPTIEGVLLTDREVAIIRFMYISTPDKTIATHLDIALSTFDGLKKKIFIKTKTDNRTGLVVKAIDNGIL